MTFQHIAMIQAACALNVICDNHHLPFSHLQHVLCQLQPPHPVRNWLQVHCAEAKIQYPGPGRGRTPDRVPVICRPAQQQPCAHCPGADPAHQGPGSGLCQS